ncbi:MAG: hypothetical protein LBH48_07225 [Bifidobacteriaceae bacterium]|jgi:hypothetical protein|nr:hypothetical protein [Bifidobacteriaceae bacterium]
MLDPRLAEEIPGDMDPALRSEIAHDTAGALVARARAAASTDPALVDRLLRLVETEGIEIVAEMWSASAADTLPGALWRIYVLREWTRDDPRLADRYRLGTARAEVAEVVAGAAAPPGPAELRDLADAVLSGVFTGDLDVALNRAAAFCRIVAIGTAIDADLLDTPAAATEATRRAAALDSTADDLERAARRWRAGTLD